MEFVLSDYSHESCLPCQLPEIVTHLRKRDIDACLQDSVGLKKDILAIPLNRGFILCAENLVLIANTLDIFHKLDGTHSLGELIDEAEVKTALQQLHYYDLLSFRSNDGRLKIAQVEARYLTKYQYRSFVTFSLIPFTVELDITNTCNFTCIHCMQNSGPNKKLDTPSNLSTEEILDIINQCGELTVPNLLLMGGEPLVHPDFFTFVQYAKEVGILHIRTSTNGWFINDDMAEKLARYFPSIQLSLHGATSSTHDYIVGKEGAWERARRAIRLLKENNVKIIISFSVMRENADEIKEMPYLMEEWGVDSLRFLRLVKKGRGCLLEGWTETEITEMGGQIKRIHRDLCSRLEIEAGGFPALLPIKNDASFYGCDAGKTLLCIAADGGVRACGSIGGDYIGHIRERSLLDTWHSPPLIDMRRQPDCYDCNYRAICWGVCKAIPG